MNSTKQQGFNLIELLVVMAIMGILATVSIPTYRDYLAKAKLVNVYSTISLLKTKAMEYYLQNGSWPETSEALDLDLTKYRTDAITNLGINNNCTDFGGGFCIIADIAKEVSGRAGKLIMQANDTDGILSWQCKSSDLKKSITPSLCSNAA